MICVEVDRLLAELDYQPLTSPSGGRLLYDFVLGSGVVDVLELGFAHGTSTLYMAAALEERGAGTVTTIDLVTARSRQPDIHTLLRHLGLERYVQPIFAERSYNWELIRFLERQSTGEGTDPCFDFCFLDGAHAWDVDGFAFFLADKLLRPDRWLLFDDLHWTYATSPSIPIEDARQLPEEERTCAQIKTVFDLLVRQHPSYQRFRIMGNYAWAYKAAATGQRDNEDAVDRFVSPEIVRLLAFGQKKPL